MIIIICAIALYAYYLSTHLTSVNDQRSSLSSRLVVIENEKREKELVIHEKDRIITEKDTLLHEKEREIRELWAKKENIVQELMSNINQKDKEYRSITDQRDQELRELRSKHVTDISSLRDEIERRNTDIEGKIKMYDDIVKGIRNFCRVLQANGNQYLLQVAYEEMGRRVNNYTSVGLEWHGNSSHMITHSEPVPAAIEPVSITTPIIAASPASSASASSPAVETSKLSSHRIVLKHRPKRAPTLPSV